jgi:hypothetical protein
MIHLKLLLEVEAEHGLANDSDSLMDRVLVGLVTSIRECILFQYTFLP